MYACLATRRGIWIADHLCVAYAQVATVSGDGGRRFSSTPMTAGQPNAPHPAVGVMWSSAPGEGRRWVCRIGDGPRIFSIINGVCRWVTRRGGYRMPARVADGGHGRRVARWGCRIIGQFGEIERIAVCRCRIGGDGEVLWSVTGRGGCRVGRWYAFRHRCTAGHVPFTISMRRVMDDEPLRKCAEWS